MKIIICEYCKKEFKSNRKKRFCSKFCLIKHTNIRRKDTQKEYYCQWYKKYGRNRADNYIEMAMNWELENPEKVQAHHKVKNAIKAHKIIKPFICEHCKTEKKLHAHHKDYNKPLDVMWLCASCHKKIHLQ